MKAYEGVDVYIRIFLTSALVAMVSFTPRQLYPREKSRRYLLNRRLRGPQCQSGRRGEEKILDFAGTRTPTLRSSSPQQVAIWTTLSRLLKK
jgi:hypothetical protein